jgi:hypothetical protein
MTTTIRFNYHCTLALPGNMKVAEVAMLFELLSRCNKIESLYASDAKESVEYQEEVELAVKRVGTTYPSRSSAELKVRDLNKAALASAAAEVVAA